MSIRSVDQLKSSLVSFILYFLFVFVLRSLNVFYVLYLCFFVAFFLFDYCESFGVRPIPSVSAVTAQIGFLIKRNELKSLCPTRTYIPLSLSLPHSHSMCTLQLNVENCIGNDSWMSGKSAEFSFLFIYMPAAMFPAKPHRQQ